MAQALLQGVDYLHKVQQLAVQAGMVDAIALQRDRPDLCTWIGTHIHTINATLQVHGEACAGCWHACDRPHVQIFAVPIATAFEIQGCCNFATTPITLLIDVGRVIPAHWQRLVIHEYAHACVGRPGHSWEFTRALTHLCLGLGVPTPDLSHYTAQQLQSFPPCTPNPSSLAFWQGQLTKDPNTKF